MYRKTNEHTEIKDYSRIFEYDHITLIDIDNILFFDPPLDSILKIDSRKLVSKLDSLVLSNLLKREEVQKIYCNNCLSTDIRKEFLCPRCKSSRVYKDIIIIHMCGYRGTRKAYQYINYLRCPKCKKELRRENDDYVVEGVKYKCIDCSKIFEEPIINYKCNSCGNNLGESPKKIKIIKYIRSL